MVYGSSMADLKKFRDGNSGFLKISMFNNHVIYKF